MNRRYLLIGLAVAAVALGGVIHDIASAKGS
jgi:hypothetical protein